MTRLFQEDLRSEPYWMLVACILVNRTRWAQAWPVFNGLRIAASTPRHIMTIKPSRDGRTLQVSRDRGRRGRPDTLRVSVGDDSPTRRRFHVRLERGPRAAPRRGFHSRDGEVLPMTEHQIIILEGPDNSGKSTLAARLRALPHITYVDMLGGRTKPREASRRHTYETLYDDAPGIFVHERHHAISDGVYRSLDHRPRIFSHVETLGILDHLSKRRARVIYCRPPFDVARNKEHVAALDDDDAWVRFALEKLPEAFKLYDVHMMAINRLGVEVIHYDWTVPWGEDILRGGMGCKTI